MSAVLSVTMDAWKDGERIPGQFAFCIPADEGHVSMSQNLSPAISWGARA